MNIRSHRSSDLSWESGAVSVDDRGSVSFVNSVDFSKVKRFYVVRNHRAGFIRAWHGHLREEKYVYVVKGAAIINAVPLSLDGSRLIDVGPFSCVMSDASPTVLRIPAGFANGFKTLTDDTEVMFFSTSTLEESMSDDYRFPVDAADLAVWDIKER